MKFKVGDNVTILADTNAGSSFVINKTRPSMNDSTMTVYIADFYGAYDEHEIELTCVFNSPLYKALNEDK